MNTIKIKHGNGIPEGVLEPYELGYIDDLGQLYIGTLGENGDKGKAIPLNYLSADIKGYIEIYDSEGSPYTTYIDNNNVYLSGYRDLNEEDVYWDRGYCLDFYDKNGQQDWITLCRFATTGTNETTDYAYIGFDKYNTWLKVYPDGKIQSKVIVADSQIQTNVLVVGESSIGTQDPNEANIPGQPGQLYFVVAG